MAQRATPKEWLNYITASASIKLLHLQNTPLDRSYSKEDTSMTENQDI